LEEVVVWILLKEKEEQLMVVVVAVGMKTVPRLLTPVCPQKFPLIHNIAISRQIWPGGWGVRPLLHEIKLIIKKVKRTKKGREHKLSKREKKMRGQD
jgi:hypothetical protein